MNVYRQEKVEALLQNFSRRNSLITAGYVLTALLVICSVFVSEDPLRWLPFDLLVIFASAYFRSVFKQNLYGPLNLVLYQDCDPETYHGAYQCLTERERIPTYQLFCILCVANGIYYMGDFDGALGYLANNVELARCNPSQKINYYSIQANCFAAKEDVEALTQLQQTLEMLSASGMKRSQQQALLSCKEIVALHLAFLQGEYQTARAACDYQLEHAVYPFQRIGIHYRLGLIDRAEGQWEAARSHFDFVAINGGGTYFVQSARQERLKMDQYLREHPKEADKQPVFPASLSQQLAQEQAQPSSSQLEQKKENK